MDAIQALPVLALWLGAGGRPASGTRSSVLRASLEYAIGVAATLVPAASGRASTDAAPVPLGLVVAALLVAAGAWVVSRPRPLAASARRR